MNALRHRSRSLAALRFLRRPSIGRPWLALSIAAAVLLLSFGGPAQAHKASDAYLQLRQQGDALTLRWDISLRDLDTLLELDRNDDQQLAWGEVKARLGDIRAYALAHLRVQQGACAWTETAPPAVEPRVDGSYLVLQLQTQCALGDTVDIDYRLFREVDPTHRGLLRIDRGVGTAPSLQPLDPTAGPVSVALDVRADSAAARRTSGGTRFFQDGVHHILIGYDHILFLLCLLLPAVLVRREAGSDGAAGSNGWKPATRWQQAVWPMVGTVTMFTLGHSITLALAGLGWVSLSPRVIEPAIALTIIVAALDNLVPVLRQHRRVFTFLFGLIHGFGFAGVLAELDLPTGSFVAALLHFNLGVEAGQLLIVTLALAVLWFVRRWRGYPRVVLQSGSVLAIGVAALWFVERVVDLKLLPF